MQSISHISWIVDIVGMNNSIDHALACGPGAGNMGYILAPVLLLLNAKKAADVLG